MAILDAPAREPHFQRAIGFIVVILVGHEEQIRRCAEPQSIKAHGDGRRKRNAFEEDLACVELPIAIRVFEDQDAAVAIGGETCAACFIVAIFLRPRRRPRSSQQNAIGCVIIGSTAASFASKPSGTVIFATACSPVRKAASLPAALAMPHITASEPWPV